jgi:pyruvate formate lyase activating enzyme
MEADREKQDNNHILGHIVGQESDMLIGKVYDIQGFSVQDGPGIRTTVFLKGCPLRCPWCHSPESQEFFEQLSWIALRCLGIGDCGRCLSVCPKDAIKPGKVMTSASTQTEITLVSVNRDLCDNCGECAKACYPHALYICGEDYTVDALLKRVLKDSPFYRQSGGGVTVSGGEPLCQLAFTLEFFKRLKENGIHTALDTTGYVTWEALESIAPYTDLFLYDIKHMQSKDHKAVTRVPNERILENAMRLSRIGAKLQVRIPLIPDFNDSEENIRATAQFCVELKGAVEVVQVLPYHNLGVTKYFRLNENVKAMEATPHAESDIQRVRCWMEEYGLDVTIH